MTAITEKSKQFTSEPLWEKASTIQSGTTAKLAVEVVSSNWQDDYEIKLAGYESVGIAEYWIIDYAGIGGVRHIGKPKQPTFTVRSLVDGEHEVSRFRKDEPVVSPLFLDIALRLS
ncbi:MAG: Uma2 family endonuclease [Cyanobacteria bacterium J06614_10]